MMIKKMFRYSCLGILLPTICGFASGDAKKDTGRFDSYKGLVMAGYQGWFNAPADGAGRGWYHYQGRGGGFAPGNCTVDMWPDVSEYEKTYETDFAFGDGTKARVFSSHDESTVDTHFRWMREYGIDGVFMQRFVGEIKGENGRAHFDKVLRSAMDASNKYERAVAVMYDLSGIRPGDERVLLQDIDRLSGLYDMKSRKQYKGYLHHNGKPLVAVWGVGFNDNRAYGLDEAEAIINGLKERGFSVLLGVPTYWRTLNRDTGSDPRLHDLIRKCDIIMPWFVGRYDSRSFAPFGKLVKDDVAWCKANKVDYVPLAFPGFSWKNMKKDSQPISRERGRFLWSQVYSHIHNGAEMLYIAMFDEIDEGTAIFKCASRVPAGESEFVALDADLGGDYYLWLAGMARKLLSGEPGIGQSVPRR